MQTYTLEEPERMPGEFIKCHRASGNVHSHIYLLLLSPHGTPVLNHVTPPCPCMIPGPILTLLSLRRSWQSHVLVHDDLGECDPVLAKETWGDVCQRHPRKVSSLLRDRQTESCPLDIVASGWGSSNSHGHQRRDKTGQSREWCREAEPAVWRALLGAHPALCFMLWKKTLFLVV